MAKEIKMVAEFAEERDVNEYQLIQEAYYRGDFEALNAMGAAFEEKGNYDKAILCYLKAVKFGSEIAMYNAALCYLYKCKVKDIDKGMDMLLKAAEKDYPDACVELSKIYRSDEIVEKDFDLSEYWLNRAFKVKSFKAFLVFAQYCLSGNNEKKEVDVDDAIDSIATYLTFGEKYFEQYQNLYDSLKEQYKNLIDWDSIEKYHQDYCNVANLRGEYILKQILENEIPCQIDE